MAIVPYKWLAHIPGLDAPGVPQLFRASLVRIR